MDKQLYAQKRKKKQKCFMWKLLVNAGVLLENMCRTVCHMVNILNDTKWCLVQDWIAPIHHLQLEYA